MQTVDILSAKQERSQRAYETTRLDFEPEQSIVNELVVLSLAFKRYREPWHLQGLRRLIENLRSRPLPIYSGLRELADVEQMVLTYKDAAKVVEDVQNLGKDVADVTVSCILKLKEGFVKGQTFLELGYLRGFIAQGCFELAKAESEGKTPDLVALTKEILRMA